jgi:hypothetical protein
LKVAKGVSVRLEEGTKVAAKATVGLNQPGGMNIQAGPRVEGTRESSTVHGFTESSDIVVGIQCLKLYYKTGWSHGKRTVVDELYMSGATFVEDDGHNEQLQTNNYVFASSEDYNLPGHTRRTGAGTEEEEEETWIVPA